MSPNVSNVPQFSRHQQHAIKVQRWWESAERQLTPLRVGMSDQNVVKNVKDVS